MSRLFDTRATAVWLLLVAASLVSWLLVAENGGGPTQRATVTGVVVIAIAFFKARLVGLYFMELRRTVPVLRALFEAYVIAGFVAVAVIYAFV